MDLAWWELIVRGTVVYLTLLLMVRLSGRRTVGQFTPFDLLVVMLLSAAVSNSLCGGDDSLSGGLIVAATLIVLNTGVALLSSNSRRMSVMLDGTAVLIGRDGRGDMMHFARAGRRNRIMSAPDLFRCSTSFRTAFSSAPAQPYRVFARCLPC